MKDEKEKLAVARGDAPAELVIKNARIVNVLSAEIHDGDIAVDDGRIVGIGAYSGREEFDAAGAFVAPALIDAHIHIESTMLTVPEFTRAVVPHGTCAVVADPHEYANVLGLRGIEYLLESTAHVPMDVFVTVSSCVPATHLETSGAQLSSDDMFLLIHRPNVVGIAEMMNYPAVYLGADSELAKIRLGRNMTVDGHAPGLSGKNLNAYILAGVRSDHECTTFAEAREKLRLGMHILMREGTAERNLHELLPLVTPANARNFSFATDDKHPADLEDEGHIDHHVREAIRAGLDPLIALQIATINTARHYRLRNHGAIAPRNWANLILFDSLEDFRPSRVYYRGKLAANDGVYTAGHGESIDTTALQDTIRIHRMIVQDLRVPAAPGSGIRVIDIVPDQIYTKAAVEAPLVVNGWVESDPDRDILKIAVIERHKATGNVGIGFVRGFGLTRGALASTVAHDAHNIVVVGTNDRDMYHAVLEIAHLNGGQVVVRDGSVIEELPLPIAGLVTEKPLKFVRQKVDSLVAAARSCGCTLSDPFMTLSFLSLSPIPSLKITDQGLVDAERFELTGLFVR